MIHLIRQDLEEGLSNVNQSYFQEEDQELGDLPPIRQELIQVPMSEVTLSRAGLIEKFDLPEDSILKLGYEGKSIPWGMVGLCNLVEVRVVRPHQNGEVIENLR